VAAHTATDTLSTMALNRRLMVGLAGLGLVAGIATAAVLASSGGDEGTTPTDAVLDQPGRYDLAPIGTNAPVEGQRLPAVMLTDLDGAEVNTDDLLGTPLVLNVWFSTCQPCKREMPAFAAVERDLGSRVRIVGINPNDTPSTAAAFAEQLGVGYPTYLDRNGEFLAQNGIATFPSTLFVDADGLIVRQTAGEITEAELRQIISDELLE
jgi:cytochrome c biogenesis protein CcmG, thiol:disulfide interchange protein DsbE